VAYVLVVVWAFVGIAVKQADTPTVAITAGLMALIVALTLVVGVPRSKQRRQNLTTEGKQ
jgi:membrane associated rhomboid family serine protease